MQFIWKFICQLCKDNLDNYQFKIIFDKHIYILYHIRHLHHIIISVRYSIDLIDYFNCLIIQFFIIIFIHQLKQFNWISTFIQKLENLSYSSIDMSMYVYLLRWWSSTKTYKLKNIFKRARQRCTGLQYSIYQASHCNGCVKYECYDRSSYYTKYKYISLNAVYFL